MKTCSLSKKSGTIYSSLQWIIQKNFEFEWQRYATIVCSDMGRYSKYEIRLIFWSWFTPIAPNLEELFYKKKNQHDISCDFPPSSTQIRMMGSHAAHRKIPTLIWKWQSTENNNIRINQMIHSKTWLRFISFAHRTVF